jgi:Fe-S cluster biogenesis protein NfuA
MHGGTVSFSRMNHETGMVTVEMAGSCSGCSSSTATLKMGVEQMLMYKFPEDVTGVDADFGEVTNPYYTDTRDGYNPWRTE